MAVLRVSNQSGLAQAINAVRSGDTIVLAAGVYDNLNLPANKSNHLKFTEKVTITSENPDNPAVISKMTARAVTNLELRDLEFDYVPSKSNDNPFWIEGGRNISVVACAFEGELKGAYGSGIGLRVKNSQDVTIEDSTFATFRNGLYSTGSTNVDVLDNDFRRISNDSMLMGGMTDVLISGNDFRDMKSDPKLKHKDHVQFYTSSGEGGSRDIVVRENVIDNGEATQGIYFTNAVASAGNLSVMHRNVLVEDNYIRSAHTLAITMNHGDGVIFRDNVVVQNPDLGNTAILHVPRIHVSTLSQNVTITGNEVASVQSPANSTWTVSGNITQRNLYHWTGAGATIGPESTGGGGGGTGGGGTGGGGTGGGGTGGGGTGGGGTGGTADLFRIDGRTVDNASVTLDGVEFAEGDRINFNYFDAGTFQQVNDFNAIDIWNSGGAVKLAKMQDVVEIVEHSDAVTARTTATDDTLILTIDQRDGPGEVALTGLGAAYDALL